MPCTRARYCRRTLTSNPNKHLCIAFHDILYNTCYDKSWSFPQRGEDLSDVCMMSLALRQWLPFFSCVSSSLSPCSAHGLYDISCDVCVIWVCSLHHFAFLPVSLSASQIKPAGARWTRTLYCPRPYTPSCGLSAVEYLSCKFQIENIWKQCAHFLEQSVFISQFVRARASAVRHQDPPGPYTDPADCCEDYCTLFKNILEMNKCQSEWDIACHMKIDIIVVREPVTACQKHQTKM